jgi:hypothetical protein
LFSIIQRVKLFKLINEIFHKRKQGTIRKLLSVKEVFQERQRWFEVDEIWNYFRVNNPIESLQCSHYVLLLREKQRKPEQHFQFNPFSANNGVYDYSTVVTAIKDRNREDLLLLISSRSAREDSIGKLKTNFAFDILSKNP